MAKTVPGLTIWQLKRDWPLVALILVMFVMGVYFYPTLPEKVPSSWSMKGEVQGYSGRGFAAFGLPLVTSALYIMFLVLPALDPKRANYHRFIKAYNAIRWSTLMLMALIHGVILLAGMGHTIDVSKIVQPATALLFIVMGNQIGRVRHNYFVGIRTPWTLANEEVWRRTHRMAGPLLVAGGIVSLAATWLPPPYNFAVLMVAVIGTSLAAVVYSYVIFKQLSVEN
ncbi:MAG: DUF1648 domain-containing protein [Firmicutes bacterium]|nr:DUF1648 domain-containing protein [Bacillota bacterium]